MQLYNSVTPSAGFDCWESGARGCRDNCECRDVQPYNSATPSAGFDHWEPGARGLGVACIHMSAAVYGEQFADIETVISSRLLGKKSATEGVINASKVYFTAENWHTPLY